MAKERAAMFSTLLLSLVMDFYSHGLIYKSRVGSIHYDYFLQVMSNHCIESGLNLYIADALVDTFRLS